MHPILYRWIFLCLHLPQSLCILIAFASSRIIFSRPSNSTPDWSTQKFSCFVEILKVNGLSLLIARPHGKSSADR